MGSTPLLTWGDSFACVSPYHQQISFSSQCKNTATAQTNLRPTYVHESILQCISVSAAPEACPPLIGNLWIATLKPFELDVQVFRGVHWSDDVFNHENIGFWHYLQPSYNVLGFISCAGTNFLVRASAFAQAGNASSLSLVCQI